MDTPPFTAMSWMVTDPAPPVSTAISAAMGKYLSGEMFSVRAGLGGVAGTITGLSSGGAETGPIKLPTCPYCGR